jgi:hypothetical protein
VAEILKLDPLYAQEEAIFKSRFGKFHRQLPPLLLPSSSQSEPDEKFFDINRYQYGRNDTEVIKQRTVN